MDLKYDNSCLVSHGQMYNYFCKWLSLEYEEIMLSEVSLKKGSLC